MVPVALRKTRTKYMKDIEKKPVFGVAFAWSATPESARKTTTDLLDS
jgi:hypothetical protein